MGAPAGAACAPGARDGAPRVVRSTRAHSPPVGGLNLNPDSIPTPYPNPSPYPSPYPIPIPIPNPNPNLYPSPNPHPSPNPPPNQVGDSGHALVRERSRAGGEALAARLPLAAPLGRRDARRAHLRACRDYRQLLRARAEPTLNPNPIPIPIHNPNPNPNPNPDPNRNPNPKLNPNAPYAGAAGATPHPPSWRSAKPPPPSRPPRTRRTNSKPNPDLNPNPSLRPKPCPNRD